MTECPSCKDKYSQHGKVKDDKIIITCKCGYRIEIPMDRRNEERIKNEVLDNN